MQQAEQANNRTDAPMSGGSARRLSAIVGSPLESIGHVTGYADVVGTLVHVARRQIEDIAMGRVVGETLSVVDNLLIAIDLIHDAEMANVNRAEDELYASGIEAFLRSKAA